MPPPPPKQSTPHSDHLLVSLWVNLYFVSFSWLTWMISDATMAILFWGSYILFHFLILISYFPLWDFMLHSVLVQLHLYCIVSITQLNAISSLYLDFVFSCLNFSFSHLDFLFSHLDFFFTCLNFSFSRLDFFLTRLDFSFSRLDFLFHSVSVQQAHLYCWSSPSVWPVAALATFAHNWSLYICTWKSENKKWK